MEVKDSLLPAAEPTELTTIEHLSVSFYMGFLNFDVSYRDFYHQRIQRNNWLRIHFSNFIPFVFWKRLIDSDVGLGFFESLLPSDYTTPDKITITHLVNFLKRFAFWDCGDTTDIEIYFKKYPRLRPRKKKK